MGKSHEVSKLVAPEFAELGVSRFVAQELIELCRELVINYVNIRIFYSRSADKKFDEFYETVHRATEIGAAFITPERAIEIKKISKRAKREKKSLSDSDANDEYRASKGAVTNKNYWFDKPIKFDDFDREFPEMISRLRKTKKLPDDMLMLWDIMQATQNQVRNLEQLASFFSVQHSSTEDLITLVLSAIGETNKEKAQNTIEGREIFNGLSPKWFDSRNSSYRLFNWKEELERDADKLINERQQHEKNLG